MSADTNSCRPPFGNRTLSRARSKAVLLGTAAISCWLGACSSYQAKPPPLTKPEAMPYRQVREGVELGVEPYVQPERQEEIFADDLSAAAIIPIQVAVRNTGDSAVRIEPPKFKLSLPGGEVVAPRPATEIAALLTPQSGPMDYVPTGLGLLGLFGGIVGSAVGTVVGGVATGAAHGSQSEAAVARNEDYQRKELKPVTLERDESTRGFLFFSPPAGTPAFDEATLSFAANDSEAASVGIKLALRGLGYKSRLAGN